MKVRGKMKQTKRDIPFFVFTILLFVLGFFFFLSPFFDNGFDWFHTITEGAYNSPEKELVPRCWSHFYGLFIIIMASLMAYEIVKKTNATNKNVSSKEEMSGVKIETSSGLKELLENYKKELRNSYRIYCILFSTFFILALGDILYIDSFIIFLFLNLCGIICVVFFILAHKRYKFIVNLINILPSNSDNKTTPKT